MRQVGSTARRETLVVALSVALGLQTLRAFFALLVYVYGARPGVTSIDMGMVAIAVFLTSFLAAVPQRFLGPRRTLQATAALLVLTRLGVQAAEPAAAFWGAAAGTVAFLWLVPALLGMARGGGQEGTARLAIGILGGLALDVAIAGVFATWDPIWQRTPTAVIVTLAVILIYARLVAGVGQVEIDPARTDTSSGNARTLVAIGPLLLLHLLIFQNVARLTAVTGWPLTWALFWVLVTDALAIAVAGMVRHPRLALVAALGLILGASWAHGGGSGATGSGVAIALTVGTIASAIVLVAPAAAQGEDLKPGLGRTAVGWGVGMVLFIVPAFLYYAGYDLTLPFENAVLPPTLAVVAALAAASPGRPLSRVPEIRSVLARLVRTLAVVTPLLLWGVTRAPQEVISGGWPVRVMSYNLHQGYSTSGAHDLEALARTIEEAGAEVVALQEVSRGWVINGSTEMLSWLARRLRMTYAWGPAADAIWGNAILSKRPILKSELRMLPRGGVPMRRSVLWAEVEVSGRDRLLVLATHFHHVEAHGHVREPQAAALVALWNKRDRAVIMGDFNATPDAREIAILREAGLLDAFMLAGQGHGFTFRSDRPERRIDYIWVTPDLLVEDFRVLPGQASDHLGIAVTVRR